MTFNNFVVAVAITVMMMQAADATCSLAAIWLALGPSHGREAAQQLRSVLPTVLGNGDTGITIIVGTVTHAGWNIVLARWLGTTTSLSLI